MPKAKRQKRNVLTAIKISLAAIGKPVYFVISRILIAIVFILYIVGHVVNFIIGIFIKLRLPRLQVPHYSIKNAISKLFPKKTSHKRKKIFGEMPENAFVIARRHIKPIVPILVFLASLFLLIFSLYFSVLKDLPSPKELDKRSPDVSTKIYDRNGNLLYKIYKNQNRTIVPLSQIPVHVRLATLAAEDAEFYNHPGFSVKGIFRALVQNIKPGNTQGGSTITQQLVKNVLLSPEKTLTRKIREIILSVEVEFAYTKDQILEMYLNEVSYGGTAYGIEEASMSYFGKDAKDLNLAEAAFLAGLPQSPTTYSPFGQNPELSFSRQREVLDLMRINKFITKAQEDEALTTRISFISNRSAIKAPHFVMYIRQLLVDKYGEETVEKGGLEVVTSLDLPTQEMAEKIVNSEVNKLKQLRVGNGAALVMNPKTGEILAMVGSKDYFDAAADGNVNVTLRLRQPGSSIKLINYAYALSNNYNPASIIDDSPITYVTAGSPPYSPVNYDGKFVGRLTLRSALAQSRNVPAVKVLASYGVSKMVEEGDLMGITTWDDPKNFGLSLTLGGGAVKMVDLARAYATVASYGKRPEISPILQVKNYKGKVLQSVKNLDLPTVLDPRVAYMLIDILKDNSARAPEFGYNSALVIKNHPEVAVKTGTSNDLRDNWTFGFNQDYLVSTWVGNNDNTPMSRIASGVTGASPIWNKIMSSLLTNKESIEWEIPNGLIKINCPGKSEWFLKEKAPKDYCQPIVYPTPQPISGPEIR